MIVLLGDPAETTDRPRVAAYYTAAHTNYARDYMAAAETAIPPLEAWFGTPRRKVVIVELTDPNALPYDAGAYYFVPMRSVLPAAAEVAMARPVAHAMLDSPRPWIREGLTGFAQALIRERQAGRRAALAYLGQFSSALVVAEAESHSPQRPTPQPSSLPPGDSSSDAAARNRSAAAHHIRRTMCFFAPRPPTSGGCCAIWWATVALQSALAHYRPAEDRDTAYMQRLIEKQDGGEARSRSLLRRLGLPRPGPAAVAGGLGLRAPYARRADSDRRDH